MDNPRLMKAKLSQTGLHCTLEWVEAFMEWCQEEQPDLDARGLLFKMQEQWTITDITTDGVMERFVLPPGITGKDTDILTLVTFSSQMLRTPARLCCRASTRSRSSSPTTSGAPPTASCRSCTTWTWRTPGSPRRTARPARPGAAAIRYAEYKHRTLTMNGSPGHSGGTVSTIMGAPTSENVNAKVLADM